MVFIEDLQFDIGSFHCLPDILLCVSSMILTNMLLLSILHIAKVLGQRGPAGGKRPALTPAQQSPGPVLLEVVLTHWSIHVHRGTPQVLS